MNKNKFDFYEIVKVNSDKLSLREINALEGAITGMSQNEETGQWGYAVRIYKTEECWHVMEYDLLPTGKKAKREDFYSGKTVRVRVDPKTGEGTLVDD